MRICSFTVIVTATLIATSSHADNGPTMRVYDVVVAGRVVGPVGLLSRGEIIAVDAETGASFSLIHALVHSLERTEEGYIATFATKNDDPRLMQLALHQLYLPALDSPRGRPALFARAAVCAALRRPGVRMLNPRWLHEAFPEATQYEREAYAAVTAGTRDHVDDARYDLEWVKKALVPCHGFARDRITRGDNSPTCENALAYWICHRDGRRQRQRCEAVERTSFWPCGRMAFLQNATLETARARCADGYRFACERASRLACQSPADACWHGPPIRR